MLLAYRFMMYPRCCGAQNMDDIRFQNILNMIQFYNDEELLLLNNHPTESEIESHLVTPLLEVLGWDRRYISFNRNCGPGKQADICLHNSLDRNNNDFVIGVIEVKKNSNFKSTAKIDMALEQAKKYAQNFNNCKLIAATDGYNYNLLPNKGSIEVSEINMQDLKKKLFSDVFPNSFNH